MTIVGQTEDGDEAEGSSNVSSFSLCFSSEGDLMVRRRRRRESGDLRRRGESGDPRRRGSEEGSLRGSWDDHGDERRDRTAIIRRQKETSRLIDSLL